MFSLNLFIAMFFEDADAILHMLLVLALDILRLHGRLGGGGGWRTSCIMGDEQMMNTSIVSSQEWSCALMQMIIRRYSVLVTIMYRVYNIGIPTI